MKGHALIAMLGGLIGGWSPFGGRRHHSPKRYQAKPAQTELQRAEALHAAELKRLRRIERNKRASGRD